jgi:RND family efflux transporter MFP subunit
LPLRIISERPEVAGPAPQPTTGAGPARLRPARPANPSAAPGQPVRQSATPEPRPAQAKPAAPRGAATLLQLQGTLLGHDNFHEAATAFATQLADVLGAARVAIGFFESGYAEVAAVSREADFEGRNELFRLVGTAMDEAIEQGVTIVHPGRPGDRPRITLAHTELARHWGGVTITVPLVVDGRPVGAIALGGADNVAANAEAVAFCEHLACILAPILVLKRAADRRWYQRLGQAVFDLRERAGRPGTTRTMLGATAVVLAAAIALVAWPVEYRVTAPARVEGAIQRSLVAPADGFLRQIHVKPGDAVKAGQVLVELADQDLELERLKWTAEFAQHQNSSRSALARTERTEYVVAVGKAQEAKAQLDLVEQAIQRASVRAPFDGTVIKGDLSQTLGAPVRRGDVLLTVAPSNEFRLVVEVDERDIADIAPGATGEVHLAALPRESVPFRVTRVTPVATSRDARNFYEIEGRPGALPAGLRPGLQGVAKIGADDRTLAWIWTHRLVDWARLALWSLGG